jgi:hypothetical protein
MKGVVLNNSRERNQTSRGKAISSDNLKSGKERSMRRRYFFVAVSLKAPPEPETLRLYVRHYTADIFHGNIHKLKFQAVNF